MTHQIKLTNVDLDYFVYSLRSQSLRSAVFNLAVGGKMYKAAGDVAAVKALSDINLEINEGDRIALVGHNGSGKTTLLKVIAGIYHPTRGELHIDGDITSMIAINAGVDMEATGLRNIHKLGLMRRLPRKVIDSRVDAIAEFSGLGDFLHLPVRTYSAGMLARLMFSSRPNSRPTSWCWTNGSAPATQTSSRRPGSACRRWWRRPRSSSWPPMTTT